MHTITTGNVAYKLRNNLPACTDFADAFFYHLDRRCLQRRLMPQGWGKNDREERESTADVAALAVVRRYCPKRYSKWWLATGLITFTCVYQRKHKLKFCLFCTLVVFLVIILQNLEFIQSFFLSNATSVVLVCNFTWPF